MEGEIDGRKWVTKPDMLFSAVALAQAKRRLGKRLQLIGDTLPAALERKGPAFLDSIARLEKRADIGAGLPDQAAFAAAGGTMVGAGFKPRVWRAEPEAVDALAVAG
jgi:hypothetical protein